MPPNVPQQSRSVWRASTWLQLSSGLELLIAALFALGWLVTFNSPTGQSNTAGNLMMTSAGFLGTLAWGTFRKRWWTGRVELAFLVSLPLMILYFCYQQRL